MTSRWDARMGNCGCAGPEIVKILDRMASILELSGASPFEVMAYRNGAQNFEEWDGDVQAAAVAGTLREIEGVGKGLAGVISDLALTGQSAEYQRLLGLFPSGLLDVLSVPGLGPKKIKVLYEQLSVDSLDALESAAKAEKIRGLKGFGAKSEEKILVGVERARRWLKKSEGDE